MLITLCADQVQVSAISQSGFLLIFRPERVIACDYISLTPGNLVTKDLSNLTDSSTLKSAARKFNTTVAGV